MNRVIINAILRMNRLSFTYGGELRLVEPHCYGRDTNGHNALRAWQPGKGWRMFHEDEMIGLQVKEAFAAPQPDYRREDKGMAKIFAQI